MFLFVVVVIYFTFRSPRAPYFCFGDLKITLFIFHIYLFNPNNNKIIDNMEIDIFKKFKRLFEFYLWYIKITSACLNIYCGLMENLFLYTKSVFVDRANRRLRISLTPKPK